MRNKKNTWKTDIRIATELFYPEIVINKLKEEANQIRRINILHDARNGVYTRKK